MASVDIIEYSNRVNYKMYNVDAGWSPALPEPKGWDDDDKELKRSLKVFGVFTKLATNLEFSGAAYDYIKSIYLIYGVEAEVIMIKSEKHPDTDEWEIRYTGYLDLVTLKISRDTLKCNFNESGFYKKILARQSEDFELTRLDDIDGTAIDPLDIAKVDLQGQKIFLVSRLEFDDQNPTITTEHENKLFGDDWEGTTIPWAVDFANDTLVDPIQGDYNVPVNNDGNYQGGNAENMFYGVNDRDKTLHIQIQCVASWGGNYSAHGNRIRFELVKYNSYNYDYVETLATFYSINNERYGNDFPFNADFYIYLEEGMSLALVFRTRSDANINFTYQEGNFLLVEEESFVDPSKSNVLLPHEAGERLVQIMTGSEEAFKSDFFGRADLYSKEGVRRYSVDGSGSKVGLMYGFWIRGFDAIPPVIPDDISDDERSDIIYEQPVTTSFKKFFESYSNTFNLGYGIETFGGKERLVIEELDYFFIAEVRVTIPNQVSKVVRKPAKEFMFRALTFGQKKGGDFEEKMGLDEFNVTTSYTTSLVRTELDMKKETEYRKDGYAIELIRRKPKSDFPTEDTDNDDSIFMYDMKSQETGIYTGVLWADRFEELPKNIFSPETAQNLWLSPANCLKRFGWWLKASLQLYPDKFIRYSSSTGNSNLVTKLIGEEELKERAKIKNSSLERNLFKPEWIEFSAQVTREIIDQVYGSTNGTPNFYGLVSFTNELNVLEFGYLFSLKPSKEGKWKLLKANR